MPAIATNVTVETDDFRANRAEHLKLIAEFRALEQKVRDSSSCAYGRILQRGQLPPPERVNWLLDCDSPFLALTSHSGLGMLEDDGVDKVSGGGSIVGM